MRFLVRFYTWARRRRQTPSAIARLRQRDDATLHVKPWEPSERVPELRSDDARITSLEGRQGRTGKPPKGIADEDWHTRRAG
jgi:hypothetical protein